MPAELIAEASVDSVMSLSALSTLNVCPWMVKLPERVSFGSDTALDTSDEVCANESITIVWLPADAVTLAEVRFKRFVFELDPCFSEKTPLKSVNVCKLVVNVARSLPNVDKTVSCACNAVCWVFQGVSIACSDAWICVTVEATSNPWPLVADPKLNPTVPI
jgi:hypothetical protein